MKSWVTAVRDVFNGVDLTFYGATMQTSDLHLWKGKEEYKKRERYTKRGDERRGEKKRKAK